MSEETIFDYYYGMESELFSFIKIPKLLLFDPKFSDLSLGAVMLYGLLLDRMGLSTRRGWRDEEGKVYIRYKIKDIECDLNLSEKQPPSI
ncbi:MAG: replication initiator protein A [Lachnospiraceae bacterium]|nr:replication initiator protein A [Lachnospiraceae bacterium]